MRLLDAGTTAAIKERITRWAILVKIVTPSLTIRMTSLHDDFVYGGETYLPGTLGDISGVTEKKKIESTGITLTFAANDPATLAAIVAQNVVNSAVSVYIVPLNAYNVALGDGINYFSGYVDTPSVTWGNNAKVVLNCKDKLSALARPKLTRFANQEWQKRYPGDKGMEYAAIVASKEIVWPSASWFKNNS